ncbi:MAG: PrpF domain-containing protein [Corynebacterium casei]|nr:PrpF domain-containing protein [Corynebacterium casei]
MEIQARWMRGGTSKCWVFESEELESQSSTVDEVLLRAFGSPDVRQLDGVGGGTSTTSKAVIISPSDDPDIDIKFSFAQIGIEEAKVDWGSNCGNCSATVGLYGIETGLVKPDADVTRIRVLNENTNQVIVQSLETPNGKLLDSLTETMPGTKFAGHKVVLGFTNPEGKTTGALFPTGNKTDQIEIDNRVFSVTLIDAGAPVALVAAKDFGLAADNYEDWASTISMQLEVLDGIRRRASVLMGLSDSPAAAARAIPKIGVVDPSTDDDSDLKILMLSMGKLHPAIPVTGSVAISKAILEEGTVAFSDSARPESLRILTPVGVIETKVSKDDFATEIGVVRTSRTIADAKLFLPEDDSVSNRIEVA